MSLDMPPRAGPAEKEVASRMGCQILMSCVTGVAHELSPYEPETLISAGPYGPALQILDSFDIAEEVQQGGVVPF